MVENKVDIEIEVYRYGEINRYMLKLRKRLR